MTEDYMTIAQFVEKHKFLTENGLRWMIFKDSEGLEECLVRRANRIWIKEEMFFKFLEIQSDKEKEKKKKTKKPFVPMKSPYIKVKDRK
jgi:hypothetical protein